MGFPEATSMIAVKKYGKNLDKSINYIISITSKQNDKTDDNEYKKETISNEENGDNVM